MLKAATKAGPVRPATSFPATPLLLAWAAFVVYGSLLPFDFRAVDLNRAAHDFLALADQAGEIRSFTDWATNIFIFVPLGFLGFSAIERGRSFDNAASVGVLVLGACVLLSIGIECTQIFFPPRDSSVLDVIANAIGAGVGELGWYVLGDATVVAYTALIKTQYGHRLPGLPGKLRTALTVGCGLLIAGWGGFFTTHWAGWDVAIAHMADIHLLPFTQHQAAQISLALLSTAMATLVYGSLGLVLRFFDVGGEHALKTRLFVVSTGVAAVAVLVEGAKLFLKTRSPDTANIVIAGLAASVGYLIFPFVTTLLTQTESRVALSRNNHKPRLPATAMFGLSTGRAMALICAAATCGLVVTYPVGQVQLGTALFVYCAVLVRYPTAWLVVIPALLPVLDLAPWTGRFFFDEFDGFVLTTLAVGLWRTAGAPLAVWRDRVLCLLSAGFLASFLISAVIGLLPLQPLDANAFASHYSHYASLRLAKGMLFSVGLAMLISSHVAVGLDVKRVFSAGMITGLASAAGSVIWERTAYAGLTDFAIDFRATGLFSTMHTGGAHLDAFLVTALPFAATWALRTRHPAARFTAMLLFSAGTYAVMMTFARAAVAALVLAVLVIAAWAFLTRRQMTGATIHTGIKIAAVLALAGLVASPILVASFMQSRFATTRADLDIRHGHWNEAVGMMTGNWRTSVFGMGLGRFPETYMLLSGDKSKPSVHRFDTEAENTFLRISKGARLYVEQIVAVEPHRDYKLALKARTPGPKATLNILLCDRTFLDGYGCQSATFQMAGDAGKWQTFQATLHSAAVGENHMRLSKLSLENAGSQTPIDIDEVSLIDSDGKNHMANGNFQAGADRWFFSTPNNHLPWHIKNLWLEVFFEQGWLGLVMFCALSAVMVVKLAMMALQGQGFAAASLTGLIGFLAVGAFDSLFDAPRLTLMFGLLIAAAGITYAQPQAPTQTHGVSDAPGTSHGVKPKTVSAPSVPRMPEGRSTHLNVIVSVLMLAVVIGVMTRIPFLPYRVRGLPNPYHPILAPILLSAFVFWVFGLPAIAARWLTAAKHRGSAFPLLVAVHGLVGWVMVQYAVLPDSIHTVIGSPVLNWPWPAEDIARFVPLLSVISVQLTGGALIAAALIGSRLSAAPVWWLVSAALLFPIQYWVIVTQAATDNLVELMAGSASFGAFLLLTTYMMLIGILGSLLASLRSGTHPTRIGLTLTSLVFSLPLGYLLLAFGTESTILKNQTVFSALQSLLSTDRAHYATGPELWIRFGVAHLAAVCITALTQHPLWRGFQKRAASQRRWMSP